ncbi:hypothetical protein [Ralstonia pseudosolanacearum]|uniref:hypothetical protein n=1 Tax=Ralstonia pseudosolanacearum TaxID=1310165 RepID=UPI003D02C1B2
MRTLKEIEEEMDSVQNTGNIGRMMDLVDEHGNTFDKMHQAIAEGDLDRIAELEKLGMKITDAQFWKSAIISDQLLVIIYQINKGANVNQIINFSRPKDKPMEIGRLRFSGNKTIWQWAKAWKSANELSRKLPQKGQHEKEPKI